MTIQARRRTCFLRSFQYKREIARVILLALALLTLALKAFAQDGVKVDAPQVIQSDRHSAILICPSVEIADEWRKQLEAAEIEKLKDWKLEFKMKEGNADAESRVSIQLFESSPSQWVIRKTITNSKDESSSKDFEAKEDRDAWIFFLKLNTPTEISTKDSSKIKLDWLGPATAGFCRTNRRTKFSPSKKEAKPVEMEIKANDQSLRKATLEESTIEVISKMATTDASHSVCIFQTQETEKDKRAKNPTEAIHQFSLLAPEVATKLKEWTIHRDRIKKMLE